MAGEKRRPANCGSKYRPRRRPDSVGASEIAVGFCTDCVIAKQWKWLLGFFIEPRRNTMSPSHRAWRQHRSLVRLAWLLYVGFFPGVIALTGLFQMILDT